MEPIYSFNIKKVINNKKIDYKDTLIREIKTDIFVNNKKIASMMVTPIDLDALAIGYLISENIISSNKDIEKIEIKKDGLIIDIKTKENIKNLEKLSEEAIIVSGCGKSISSNIDIDPSKIKAQKINSKKKIKANAIFDMMKKFYTSCPLYEKTGCVHTARLYFDNKNYFDAEDIAQHNTVDKVMGKAKLAKVDTTRAVLLVSGRLSSEMVAKAVMHEVPILVSRTASTCLGVRIADKFGITLVGFVRGDRMNIYTNDWRIDG